MRRSSRVGGKTKAALVTVLTIVVAVSVGVAVFVLLQRYAIPMPGARAALSKAQKGIDAAGAGTIASKAAISDPLAGAVALTDHTYYAELDGIEPLSEQAIAKAARPHPRRDHLGTFRAVMRRRYSARDSREVQQGLIDLEKSGLSRQTDADVVEWRYLRAHQHLAFNGRPREMTALLTHTRLATAAHCDTNRPAALETAARWSWRQPYEAKMTVPTTESGAPIVSARELVRRRVAVWQPHEETEEFLSRPTALCVTLVSKPSRLEMAFTQFRLWGRYCDSHLIFVPRLPADVIAETDFDEGFSAERAAELAAKYEFPATDLHFVEIHTISGDHEHTPAPAATGDGPGARQHLPPQTAADGGTADDMLHALKARREAHIRRSRWQFFRETVKILDAWTRFSFYDFTFFVGEDVYAIPENLYDLLNQPDVKLLHQLGTPLLLGNRMAVPADEGSVVSVVVDNTEAANHDDAAQLSALAKAAGAAETLTSRLPDVASIPSAGATPYVADHAFIMNQGAVRLFFSRQFTPACFPHASVAAIDVTLARCMAPAGVYPRDTADTDGLDRLPVLSLNWLARTAVDAQASWWYPRYRPRPMPRGYAVVSSRAIAFPLVTTAADMATLHAWVFEPKGTAALIGA
jgi:hypothetical protein